MQESIARICVSPNNLDSLFFFLGNLFAGLGNGHTIVDAHNKNFQSVNVRADSLSFGSIIGFFHHSMRANEIVSGDDIQLSLQRDNVRIGTQIEQLL